MLVVGLHRRLLLLAPSVPRSSPGSLLLLLFGYAFSWVFALLGLLASSPEAANAFGFIVDLPAHLHLLGLRAGGVDAGLAAVVRRRINPFTIMVDAIRALLLGAPAGNNVWGAVAWSLGLIAVFAPLAVRATAPRSSRSRCVGAERGRTGGQPRWDAPVGRQPRAGDDQQQAGDRPGPRALVEGDDPERDGDHRGDVRDHQRPPGPDLDHQRPEEHERAAVHRTPSAISDAIASPERGRRAARASAAGA